ncbi:MAG: hypothetical protein MJZ37_07830 [Bacilli bacterium]|nr:hypothetical protein [Bacilli bacterium]
MDDRKALIVLTKLIKANEKACEENLISEKVENEINEALERAVIALKRVRKLDKARERFEGSLYGNN